MIPTCTSTMSILRGMAADPYGDVADNGTVAASGIPGSVLEQSPRSNTSRVDGAPRTVRRYTCRLPVWVDVQDDDQVRDDTTGYTYAIVQIKTNRNPATGRRITLDLIRVS